MKDSCDAIERPCDLDRPAVRGPGAWAVTAIPSRVGNGGWAQEAQGACVRVGGPSYWEVRVRGQK